MSGRVGFGAFELDLDIGKLRKAGRALKLRPQPMRVLCLLVSQAGRPVSREEILEKIWGVSAHSTTRSVDNFVVKLRKKIEENAAKPRHIVTIYGTGYKLVP